MKIENNGIVDGDSKQRPHKLKLLNTKNKANTIKTVKYCGG